MRTLIRAKKGEPQLESEEAPFVRRRPWGGKRRHDPSRKEKDQWPYLPLRRKCGSRRRPEPAPLQDTNPQPELDDHYLVALAKEGRSDAYDAIIRRYRGFVRLKASSYFLLGGESDDLIQEGLLGLYKAVRDYRTDRESSFRNFAELCITRQIITAVKTATRNKHTPLNQYVSFSQTPAAAGRLGDDPGRDPARAQRHDPVNQVIATEELESLVSCLSGVSGVLSDLESRVLSLYLDGHSYEVIAERLECDTKTVDNALQRVKRKVGAHLSLARGAALGQLVGRQVGEHVVEQLAAVVRGDGDVVGLDSGPGAATACAGRRRRRGGWGRRRRRRPRARSRWSAASAVAGVSSGRST